MLELWQIEELVESNYQQEYFVWRVGSQSNNITEFYNEEVEDELDEATIALALDINCTYSTAEEHISNQEYLVLTDTESDELATTRANDRADEDFWDIPEHLKEYVDKDKYIYDLLGDRGNLLDYWDGCGSEETVNGTTYYIYRQ